MVIDKSALANTEPIAPPAYAFAPGAPTETERDAYWQAPNPQQWTSATSQQPQQPSPQQQLGQPQWSQAPQPPQQAQLTTVQLGEQYRSAQFAKCAQGNHQRRTRYGLCGIITAVVLFPVGLICLFLDTKEICTVCGERVE